MQFSILNLSGSREADKFSVQQLTKNRNLPRVAPPKDTGNKVSQETRKFFSDPSATIPKPVEWMREHILEDTEDAERCRSWLKRHDLSTLDLKEEDKSILKRVNEKFPDLFAQVDDRTPMISVCDGAQKNRLPKNLFFLEAPEVLDLKEDDPVYLFMQGKGFLGFKPVDVPLVKAFEEAGCEGLGPQNQLENFFYRPIPSWLEVVEEAYRFKSNQTFLALACHLLRPNAKSIPNDFFEPLNPLFEACQTLREKGIVTFIMNESLIFYLDVDELKSKDNERHSAINTLSEYMAIMLCLNPKNETLSHEDTVRVFDQFPKVRRFSMDNTELAFIPRSDDLIQLNLSKSHKIETVDLPNAEIVLIRNCKGLKTVNLPKAKHLLGNFDASVSVSIPKSCRRSHF